MKPKMNFPIYHIKDNNPKNNDLRNRIIANKSWLMCSAVALALLIYGIIKVAWIEWVYITITLLFIVCMGAYILLFEPRPKSGEESESESEPKPKPESKPAPQSTLKLEDEPVPELKGIKNSAQISEIEERIKQKEVEIARLKMDLASVEEVIESKYRAVWVLLQELNRCVEGLPESDRSYIDATQQEISRLLSLYGYTFVDLTPRNLDFYDYERWPIDSPRVTRKAIVTADGKLFVKGMAQLPEDHGKDIDK